MIGASMLRRSLALVVGLLVVPLGSCTPSTASTAPAVATSLSATPPPFEPGPRYSTTFEAHYEGCRGPLDEHHGAAVLTIAPTRETTLELTLDSRDLLRGTGIVVIGLDGQPIEPAGPIVCRFSGVGALVDEGYAATLSAGDEPEGSHCGEPSPFELRCRPETLMLPDAQGAMASTEVLRCVLGTPKPAVLWVLGEGNEITLADTPLHSRLQQATMGIPQHVLLRGGVPAAAQ